MTQTTSFTEVEHKFIVSDPPKPCNGPFDVQAFCARALAMGPSRTSEVEVEDTYYVTDLHSGLIFRHRIDSERQELTMKSLGGDSESRLEVSLRLDTDIAGNQRERVHAFLDPNGIRWHGTLHKHSRYFYFPDCEVVYYRATVGERAIECVEFEALGHGGDTERALATLDRYEQALGFGDRERTRQSLFQLILAPLMPEHTSGRA